MHQLTENRNENSPDEIWLLEHPPVFTLGLNGKNEHVLDAGNIPVVKCDRGGQVTYHGPGQLIVYLLLDLKRRNLGIKKLVSIMEQAVIDLLSDHGIKGERRDKAPGVYIYNAKIAALGLRVRHGCSYHGLSLNIDMDLEPFTRINPCGFPGLAATQIHDHLPGITMEEISTAVLTHLQKKLATTS